MERMNELCLVFDTVFSEVIIPSEVFTTSIISCTFFLQTQDFNCIVLATILINATQNMIRENC